MNNIQDNYFNREKSLTENNVSHQFSFNILLMIFSLFILNQTAEAATIVINAPDRVSAGNNFAVDIGISDLDPTTDLGAFSFDFLIIGDPAIYSLQATLFDNHLGNPNDPFETFVDIQNNPNRSATELEIYEVSLLLDLSSQPDDFTLFTAHIFSFPFQQFANKNLTVGARNFVLSDAFGNEISPSNTGVSKRIAVVPEPGVLLLIALGLSGFRLVHNNKLI
jgi:hypothetical protein